MSLIPPAPTALRMRSQAQHTFRRFSTSPTNLAAKKIAPKRASSVEAHHRPSLGGSSLGHLFSEISATRPGMEQGRVEGQTMSEEHRTLARNVVKWIMGVPVIIGTAIVGVNFFGFLE